MAVGLDNFVGTFEEDPELSKSNPTKTESGHAAAVAENASHSKKAKVVALLKSHDGASIEELMQATDWQQHNSATIGNRAECTGGFLRTLCVSENYCKSKTCWRS